MKRSCQDDTRYEEDSQTTTPLRAISRSTIPDFDSSRLHKPTLGKVFLSVAPSDELVVAPLMADLKQRGVLLANDFVGPISDQEEALRRAIRSAHRVVVVVTPRTRTSRLIREHL